MSNVSTLKAKNDNTQKANIQMYKVEVFLDDLEVLDLLSFLDKTYDSIYYATTKLESTEDTR